MSEIDAKVEIELKKFNWDDIDVGNHQFDHSQNFFAQKHIEHERDNNFDNLEVLNKEMELANINGSREEILSTENKENIINKQIKNEVNNYSSSAAQQKNTLQVDHVSSVCSTVPSPQQASASKLEVTLQTCKQPPNIACQWSTQKGAVPKGHVATAASKAMPPPPNAYLIKDVYKRKKEEALRKRLEEERKMREFHSRPAPNYTAHHEKLKRQAVCQITVPITPLVLKKSQEADEKRKKKLDDWKRKHQPLKFEAKPAHILKEDKFLPKKSPLVMQQYPFKLRIEKRLEERKQFDVAVQRAREEKEKQEEEERKKREEEQVKALRKLTTFKARPNPSK